LKGPLTVSNTITQILDREVKDPKLKRLIKTIEKVNQEAINLIRDLTQREFLETTEVVLVKKRIDIVTKLKEVMEEYEKSEKETKRKFEFSSSKTRIFLNLDEAKFMQIINNLTTNALKFTKDDGIISLRLEDKKDKVLMIFSDNGIGIPEQYHSKLFEKFTDARRTGLRGEPTVGLGLSIVKILVEWHEGEIWFESKENVGTTFFIEFPKY
jgi:two-component system, OmpR family, sensor histidine kinase VicK